MGSKNYWIDFFVREIRDRVSAMEKENKENKAAVRQGVVDAYLQEHPELAEWCSRDAELSEELKVLEEGVKNLKDEINRGRVKFNYYFSSSNSYYDRDKAPNERLDIVLSDEIREAVEACDWHKEIVKTRGLERKIIARINLATTDKRLMDTVREIAEQLGVDLS